MPAEVPLACTLDHADLLRRLADARALGADALIEVQVSGRDARLRFDGDLERVQALAAAESRCCGFLEFALSHTDHQVDLEIRAPEGAESMLRSIAAAVVAGWEGGL